MNATADVGVIGLGVMGWNLARNLRERGFQVAVWERDEAVVRKFAQGFGDSFTVCRTIQSLAGAVKRPRALLLLVPAGDAVDDVLAALNPLLERDDVVVDLGNSHFRHTTHRAKALAAHQVAFIGAGMSGGREGALGGACIMAGGTERAWKKVEGRLQAIAARVDGRPCCALLGPDGAGHFVKTVHNGIEYAAMQIIAEAYHLCRVLLGMDFSEMAVLFSTWNQGRLASFLMEITVEILGARDPESGEPLLDAIFDRAHQKGTGRWAAEAAMDLEVPAPTLSAAVSARAVSVLKEERLEAATCYPDPPVLKEGREQVVADLEHALHAAMISAYAQGFALMAAASRAYEWNLDLATVATIWRGGCIIRAGILETIRQAFGRQPELPNLLLSPVVRGGMAEDAAGWRRLTSVAVLHGVPIPAMAATHAYFESYRSGQLWANMIEAQRDRFGGHGFDRVDRPGRFHGAWEADKDRRSSPKDS